MNLYVGNLNYKVRSQFLKSVFEEYGEVHSVKIIMDRERNKSKGYAFVRMGDEQQAQRAISSLNNGQLLGRRLIVSHAKMRSSNPTNTHAQNQNVRSFD